MKFGTVFQYFSKEYIFLVETPDIIYAARILTVPETKKVDGRYSTLVAKNTPNIEKMPVYSYVILETKELKERAAHFLKTDGNNFSDLFLQQLSVTLCKEDLIKIKDEITKDGCVSLKLKELVQDIEI
jgi:hypothetical protein